MSSIAKMAGYTNRMLIFLIVSAVAISLFHMFVLRSIDRYESGGEWHNDWMKQHYQRFEAERVNAQ